MNVTCPKCQTGQTLPDPPPGGSVTTTCAVCGHSYLASAKRGSAAALQRDLAAMLGVEVATKPPTPAPFDAPADLRAQYDATSPGRGWRAWPPALRILVVVAGLAVVLLAVQFLWPGEPSPWSRLHSTWCDLTCEDPTCVAQCNGGAEVVQPDSKENKPEIKPEPKRSPRHKPKRK